MEGDTDVSNITKFILLKLQNPKNAIWNIDI